MMRLRTAVTPFFTARIVTLSVAVITATSSDLRLGAQSPAPDRRTPAFEVASVKLHASSDQQVSMIGEPGGRFTARNIPLRLLIRTAFAVQDDQIVGGPAWIGSDRFDIVAKAEDGAPPSEVGLRLQSLLTERFKLAIHRETRELPVYALVAARHDGTVGPRMRPNDCVPGKTDAAASGAPRCGSISNGFGRLTLSASPMSVIAQFLSPVVSRVVIDRTGLKGNFDVDLTWTPDRLPARAPGTPADQPVRVNGTDIDPNGPSIFTALPEQIGLKLEATKGAVEVLVIDSIEQPSPD